MAALTHLKSLQALELSLRTGSLKAAADILAITPAAVGQRVKALEDYLGVDLVVRGRSGLRPAPSLADALPYLSAGFRQLESAASALDLQRPQDIHIAAAPDLADLWLRVRMPRFKSQHPNLRLSVNGEGEAPLKLGAADCEITFGAPRPDAHALFRDYVLPVGSPEICARVAKLPQADRLQGFPLLHLDFYKDDPAVPDWGGWAIARGLNREAPTRGMRFQRITAALEAVEADSGLALCGLALIADRLERGTLSLPYPIAAGARTNHLFQARFRPESLSRPQVRRFRDWLLDEASRTQAWLERISAA